MAEQNAHDDERDTADLVAGDTADLAIDGATDLAVADTARPQAPAEQLTPAGSAVSPSSSPTPTFAATDRPARRAQAAVEARHHPSHDGALGRVVRPDGCGRRRLRVCNPRRGCRR
ncbi:hypothetical protein [Senegalimassilia anaerobia]|uniref:hypothetical protein n=1 Tax=Senegalimassilia anaerobia TaxID=1473216 RepID=UPI00265DC1BA|nr:hypothetical protein [Senegalimassilia anaerobia]